MSTLGCGGTLAQGWNDAQYERRTARKLAILHADARNRAFRVIYVARFEHAIYVLHAFQKKTRKTAMLDVRLAKRRYREVVEMESGGNR